MQRLLKVEGAIRKMQYVYKTSLFLPLFIQAFVCLSASKLSDCHLSEKIQLENVDRNCSCATGSLNTSSISELKVSGEHPISYPRKEHYRRMKFKEGKRPETSVRLRIENNYIRRDTSVPGSFT